MAILSTILGGLSLGKGLYDIFKKGSTSKDNFSDSLSVLGKFSNSLESLLGLGDSSPNYEYFANLQNELNEKAVKNQLEANKELAQYSFNLNQRAIEDQNRYNSPQEQMNRLKAAGLNPALMYGNGVTASVTGNQSEVAKHLAPQASKVDYISAKMMELQMMKMYQDVRLTQAQVEGQDLANANAASTNRVALGTEDARIFAQQLANDLVNKDITLKEALHATEVNRSTLVNNQAILAATQLGLIAAEINKVNQEVGKLKLDKSFAEKTLQNRIDLIAKQVEESGLNIDILKQEYNNLLNYGQRNNPTWQVISAASAGLGASVLNNTLGLVGKVLGKVLGRGKGSISTRVNGQTGEIISETITVPK